MKQKPEHKKYSYFLKASYRRLFYFKPAGTCLLLFYFLLKLSLIKYFLPKNLIISKLDLLGNVLNINSIIKINYPELLTIIKTTMKNLTISFCFILLLAFSYNSPAQSKGLYIPLNIKKSFDAGIRSIDGNPGKNYWQNYSDYKIKAELLPDSSTLIGSEEITYHNASPDTLDHLVIRLYQDILKKGGVREFDIGNTELTNG